MPTSASRGTRLRPARLKNRQRQVLGLIRFHVDMHDAPDAAGPRAAACRSRWPTRARGALRIDRVELAVEGRKLDRHIHPRNRAAIVAVDLRNLGPGVHGRGDRLDQIDIGLQISSASTSLVTASPSMSSVKARFCSPFGKRGGQHFLGALSPAMNRRALAVAPLRARDRRACRWAGHEPRARPPPTPSAPPPAAARRTGPRYSCRCRDTASLSASIGSTSMKRNICTLTDFVAHGPVHEPFVPPARAAEASAGGCRDARTASGRLLASSARPVPARSFMAIRSSATAACHPEKAGRSRRRFAANGAAGNAARDRMRREPNILAPA